MRVANLLDTPRLVFRNLSSLLIAAVVFCGLPATIDAHAQTKLDYFPKRVLDNDPKLDGFVRSWYSRDLAALNEPSLFLKSQRGGEESYRFLWLRTFHHPIVIRIEAKRDGSATLFVKESNGAGGYKPGTLVTDTSRPLSPEELQRFRTLLQKVDFWHMQVNQDRRGNDGAEWIMEGVRDKRYYVVSDWSPKDGPVRELGRFLAFDLARLTIPEREIY